MNPICLCICIGLSLLATLLQLAAFVAPMWYWLSKDGYFLGIGLWYVTGCFENCSQSNPTLTIESNIHYLNWNFNLIRAMETIGLIGGVALCVCLIVSRIVLQSWKYIKCWRCTTLSVAFFSSTVLMIGSLMFIAFYHTVMTESIKLSPASFPWSFIMSLIATLIFVVICVLLLVYKDGADTDPYEPSVNKMALLPNGNKHFPNSMFSDDRGSGAGSMNDHRSGFSNKAYSSDAYNPYFRPTSHVDFPSKPFHSPYRDLDTRGSPSVPSKPRYLQYKEPRYSSDRDVAYMNYTGNKLMRKQPENESIYSHYIERPRLPSRFPSDLKYTKEIRDGNSSSFMYKPYSPHRY